MTLGPGLTLPLFMPRVFADHHDPTVPAACANTLAEALPGTPRVEIVPSANHVFNTPNPMPPNAEPTPQLQQLLTALGDFALACCQNPSALRA